MADNNNGLVALIALKVVCCGVPLLLLSGVSLGGISALLGNGWIQVGGVALIAVVVARFVWRRQRPGQCSADQQKRN